MIFSLFYYATHKELYHIIHIIEQILSKQFSKKKKNSVVLSLEQGREIIM